MKTFDQTLRDLAPTIRGVASRFASRSPGMELEVLEQEIALKLWQERGSFTDTEQAEAWAARIALNHCTDLQRADMRRIKTRGSSALDVAADRAYGLGDQPDVVMEREEQDADMERTLESALSRLSPDDRGLFESYARGEPQSDAAARLGLSLAATKSRIKRIRGRLAEDLSAFDPDDSEASEVQWVGSGGATPQAPDPDDADGEPGIGDSMFDHPGGTFR